MTQYSEEFKSSIIAKMLPPNNVPVPQLVRETGIPKDTLYTWRGKHRKTLGDAAVQPPATGQLRSEEKFTVVIESASLNEVELGEYCRRKGLYPQRISAWRNACMQANTSVAPKADRTELKAQAKHIKQLEADISDAKRRPWPRRRRCWYCKKKSGRSGRTPRTENRAPGAPGSDHTDRGNL